MEWQARVLSQAEVTTCEKVKILAGKRPLVLGERVFARVLVRCTAGRSQGLNRHVLNVLLTGLEGSQLFPFFGGVCVSQDSHGAVLTPWSSFEALPQCCLSFFLFCALCKVLKWNEQELLTLPAQVRLSHVEVSGEAGLCGRKGKALQCRSRYGPNRSLWHREKVWRCDCLEAVLQFDLDIGAQLDILKVELKFYLFNFLFHFLFRLIFTCLCSGACRLPNKSERKATRLYGLAHVSVIYRRKQLDLTLKVHEDEMEQT